MKKSFYLIAALAVAMVGCNKEQNEPENAPLEGDQVYMSFKIETPSTKSATDAEGTTNSDATPDFEVGLDAENKITTVDIALVNMEKCLQVEAKNVQISETGQYYIASFNSLDMLPNTKYDVYIYANCDAPEKLWNGVPQYYVLKPGKSKPNVVQSLVNPNNFHMTLAEAPKSITTPSDMSVHTSVSTPLNLGVHKVERSVARFDIKPVNDNVYQLANDITVTLTHAAKINEAFWHYAIRRVSADGTDTDWELGKAETSSNYVVTPYYDEKIAGEDLLAEEQCYYYPMTKSGTWEWYPMPSSSSTNADNWGASTDPNYFIWQYCKENTTPKDADQIKGLSTAVVFKGRFETTDPTVSAAMAAGERIYSFENILYGSWADVKAAAAQTTDNPRFVKAVADVEADLPVNSTPDVWAERGFTGYSAVNEGTTENPEYVYYTYYYYYNRHNDNGDPHTSAPMEFAVVRNNVYKLSVDKISRLGHPSPVTDPDPDPEDPDDPAETLDYYFNVTAEVLPWTVRVNHIEF